MTRFLPIIVIALSLLGGCSTTKQIPYEGKPFYPKHDKDKVYWEEFIVYGQLLKETLVPPTGVYYSSFGHEYCMLRQVEFRAEKYLLGSGPELINFSHHAMDVCQPIAFDTRFRKSIIFLNKNEHRGIWYTGYAQLFGEDDNLQILRPQDMIVFAKHPKFREMLVNVKEPFEWEMPEYEVTRDMLEELREYGILEFEVIRGEFIETTHAGKDIYEEYLKIKFFKYLKVEELLSYGL